MTAVNHQRNTAEDSALCKRLVVYFESGKSNGGILSRYQLQILGYKYQYIQICKERKIISNWRLKKPMEVQLLRTEAISFTTFVFCLHILAV